MAKWVNVCKHCKEMGGTRAVSRPTYPPSTLSGLSGPCKNSPTGKHVPVWKYETRVN